MYPDMVISAAHHEFLFEKVIDFISLFFELITMKISQHQEDSYRNKIASENLKGLVNKTGFKRFMIQSKNFTYKGH